MKVLPISVNIYSSGLQNKNVNNNSSSYNIKPVFTGEDRFYHSGDFFDNQVNQLQKDVQNIILPYQEQHKEQFRLLGKIGYDSQEKLKLINKYETELMNKKFSAMRGEKFKKSVQNAMLYEKYASNIQEFERIVRFVEVHPTYSTDRILNEINKSRVKMHRDDGYFQTLKPYHDKYIEIKQNIDEELDNISSKNLPEFHEKIKQLNEQNKTAVMLFLISGYTDAADITTEAEQIIKDYKSKKISYDTIKRFEKLNYKIQKFEENEKDNAVVFETIDKFLSENKYYHTTNLSEEEIHHTYKLLLAKTDTIIEKAQKDIEKYNQTHQIKINSRIIDRTYKSQAKINKILAELIQKEKEKIYSQL